MLTPRPPLLEHLSNKSADPLLQFPSEVLQFTCLRHRPGNKASYGGNSNPFQGKPPRGPMRISTVQSSQPFVTQYWPLSSLLTHDQGLCTPSSHPRYLAIGLAANNFDSVPALLSCSPDQLVRPKNANTVGVGGTSALRRGHERRGDQKDLREGTINEGAPLNDVS